MIIRSINREEYPDEVMDRDEFHETIRIIGKYSGRLIVGNR